MPYLHNILALLFAALEQDVTVGAGGVDLDAFEDRSDIELVEGITSPMYVCVYDLTVILRFSRYLSSCLQIAMAC